MLVKGIGVWIGGAVWNLRAPKFSGRLIVGTHAIEATVGVENPLYHQQTLDPLVKASLVFAGHCLVEFLSPDANNDGVVANTILEAI